MMTTTTLLLAAALTAGFANPPNRAKPRVWWHWMNGNVTKQGITADLEAMASAGIGGAHVFDVGCNVPPGDVKFATPSWDEHLDWAIREAERLGLELTLVNCSGYANAGGPWVAPSNSMFFVTHSETVLRGGARYRAVKLPRETKDNGFYRDIATVAFPRPKCETDVPSDLAVTSPATNVFVLSASRPFTLRGLKFAVDFTGSWAWNRVMTLAVETSEDGKAWTKPRSLKYRVVDGGKSDCDLAKGLARLAAFAEPLTARHVRLTADLTEEFAGNLVPPRLATVRPVFRAALPELNDRVFRTKGVVEPVTRDGAADESVDPARVVDLTDRLRPDGTLDWAPPRGDDWVVVRLGYCSNGVQSHPCSEFGGGFEVDKLDAAAVARHLDAYALRYADRKGVVSVLCDSYEVGSQNWTHGLERTFAARKGYSLVPYLAVALSGRVLGSPRKTDVALADFRRVLADLFAENFAGTFARKCAEHGVTAALEPYGNGPFDDTAYAWRATQPMTEFWVDENVGASKARSGSYCRLAKEVASAAHLRGRAIVDAEGFTAFPDRGGKWLKDPFGLKATGDLLYAHGVSRMVYHRWAHQPWTKPPRLPGMTMGQWGTHFERTETWWPMVGPWLRYQARCQYLLQEGSFVGDVLVFAGDDIPRRRQPEGFLPAGVDWDLCGRDALAELKVEGGRIRCLGETTYAVLLVPTNVTVAADSRARIEALGRAGARVVTALPSPWEPDFRCADPTCELFAQHRRYADGREGYFVAYPSTNATTTVCSFRVSGKVPTIWDPETGRILRPPAWRRAGNRTEVTVPFRPCGAVFVMFEPKENPAAEPPEDENAKFAETAVTGPWKVTFPVGWYAGSDEKKAVTFTNLVDWTTHSDADLKYFSGIATYETEVRVNPTGGRTLLDLGTVKNLVEVTVNGKTYPALWRPPYVLDVTDALSTLKLSNPSTLKPSSPETLKLSLRVANLWPNRLIGDERLKPDCEWDTVCLKEIPEWVKKGEPSPTGRRAFATWRHWNKGDPLLSSGLLGPVRVRMAAGAARPLVVGVSEQHRLADENSVEDRYVRMLVGAGYAPVVIPCMTNAVALDACVARLDLLVLTGGADVDPARYGAKRAKACAEPDRVRDDFEFALVAAARRRRLPIVGICRGCQLLNVAFGGTLWQDLPSEYTNVVQGVAHGVGSYLRPEAHPAAHVVRIVPGTRLAAAVGSADLAVNSHHHQAVKALAPGFRVAARAPDGVIEAIECLDYPACGVQFHPEALAGRGVDCPAYDLPRLRTFVSALPLLCGITSE